MRHGILAVALLGALACGTAAAAPDPVIATNAVPTINLSRGGTFSGSTPMTVAYDVSRQVYHAGLGGNSSFSGFTWNSSGGLQFTTTPLNVDYRGMSYNPNTGETEVVSFNALNGGSATQGLMSMGVDASGNFTGSNVQLLASMAGLPSSQTAPAYDPARDVFYARTTGGSVTVVSRATGSAAGTISLDLSTVGANVLLDETIGYDTSYEVFVNVDTVGNRALVHRRNGTFLGQCSIPDFSPNQVRWNMGFANGQLFVFDQNSNAWRGYRIFAPASATVASTAARRYSLVSTPIVAADPTVGAVLTPQLGTPDTLSWRFGHWIPDQAAYAMAGPFYASIGRELGTVDPGLGYWVITKDAKNVTMTGTPVPSGLEVPLVDSPTGSVSFNQLGNPLLNAIPVSGLRVRRGSTTRILTDNSNALTDRVIWTWNGSGYVSLGAGATLPAGSGFWLRKVAGGDVRLIFEGPDNSIAQSPPEAKVRSARIDEPRLWELSLVARQGEWSSTPLTLGAARVEARGWNPLALALPPNPPGPLPRLAVVERDWGEMSGEYATCYLPPAERMTWAFTLAGGEVPGEIELALEGRDVPSGARFRLVDVDRGVSWDLSLGDKLAVPALAGVRALRLIADFGVSPVSMEPAALRVRAYPNPFVGSVGLAIRMARSGDVRLGLFDLRGRRVRTLERRAAPVGESVLVWDGRDEAGAPVAAGLYFARCDVGGADLSTRIVKASR